MGTNGGCPGTGDEGEQLWAFRKRGALKESLALTTCQGPLHSYHISTGLCQATQKILETIESYYRNRFHYMTIMGLSRFSVICPIFVAQWRDLNSHEKLVESI